MKIEKMKTEKKEVEQATKILLQENKHLAENMTDTLQRALPQIEKIGIEFEELGIGNLSIESLADILTNNGQSTREKAIHILSEQLEGKSRLQANSLKRIFEETIDSVFFEIKEIVNGKGYTSQLAGFTGELAPLSGPIIKYISFDEKGKPVLTEPNIQQIAEDYRLYVKTNRGKTLYDKHCAAIQALNDLAAMVSSLPNVQTSSIHVLNTFTPGSFEKSFSMPLIDYDRFVDRF